MAGVPVAALTKEVSDLLPQGALELRGSSSAEGLGDGAAEELIIGGEDAVVDAALVAPAGLSAARPLAWPAWYLGQRRGPAAG